MKYLVEDEVIGIQKICKTDKKIYYQMARERVVMESIRDKVFNQIWKDIMNDLLLTYVIIEKKEDKVCGFIQLDMKNPKIPEYGVDILNYYMDKGIGTRAATLFHTYASKWKNIEYFTWKISEENIKERKIAEHLGGSIIRKGCFFPNEVIQYGLENGILTGKELQEMCEYKIKKYIITYDRYICKDSICEYSIANIITIVN